MKPRKCFLRARPASDGGFQGCHRPPGEVGGARRESDGEEKGSPVVLL